MGLGLLTPEISRPTFYLPHLDVGPAIPMAKQLGWAHKLGGEVSGDLQGRSNGVSQVDGVSDMAPTQRE